MATKVYPTGSSVLIEHDGGRKEVFPYGSFLTATVDVDRITITDNLGKLIVRNTYYTALVDKYDATFGASPGAVVSALNTIFQLEDVDLPQLKTDAVVHSDSLSSFDTIETFQSSTQGFVMVSSDTVLGNVILKPLSSLLADGDNILPNIIFDIASPGNSVEGSLVYDIDRETLIFNSPHGELALGETFKPAINNTASTIPAGSVVKAVGIDGERFEVELFSATMPGSEELYFIGVTQAEMIAGASGIVVSEGVVKHIDTSSHPVNTIYYASTTAGAFTTTKPTPPNLGVVVAMVIKQAAQGMIYVRPTAYAHLNELHDVKIVNPSEDDILAYDSTQEIWYNNTIVGLGAVTSVNTVTPSSGNVTLDTDDISEGSTNEYYTDAKVDARIAALVNETAPVTILSAGIVLENSSYDNQFLVINSAQDVDVEMEGYAVYDGWELGTEFYFMQAGAGTINLVSLGPQFFYPSDKALISRTQYSVIGMKCIVAPTSSSEGYWAVFGDLKDA